MNVRSNRIIAGAVVLAVGASGLAAASAQARPSATYSMAATNNLKFSKTSIRARAGSVTLRMSNPTRLPHAVAIKGRGVRATGRTVNRGGVSRVTRRLRRGTYTFYCPVGNHEAAGMKGRLTVR
jgi:plastocyanin